MFDKNTIIAFVLIILILILWQYWWGKTAAPPGPQPITPADSLASDTIPAVAQPRTDSTAAVARLDTARVTADTIPERLIQVETQYYSAILTNKGGGLVSLKLKHYRLTDSIQLNLLPDGASATPTLSSNTNAFNDRSLTYLSADTSFALAEGDPPRSVKFAVQLPGKGEISKEFIFYEDKYNFDLSLSIAGSSKIGLEREYVLAWLPPIPPSEKNLNDDFGSYKGGVYLSGEMYKIDSFDDQNRLKDDPSGSAQWVGSRSKYFAYAMIPKNGLSSGATFRGERQSVTAAEGNYVRRSISAGIVMPVGSKEIVSDQFTVFAGPLDYRLLKTYNVDLEDFIDWGWKIIRPFSYAIYWLTYQLHRLIPNYGFVIIVMAILMKVVTYPLTKKSLKSMQAMKRLQPKLEEIKAKYKSDPQKLNQATMKLYKEAGVNPFSGCLLMLPQMPLFFGLYQVFRSTIEFRQAYFLGYWPDLSQPDEFPYVMPIIMTLAMFVQQKLSITDPKQKLMVYLMPVLFFFFMKGLPVGLVLYWTAYSVLSIVESMTIKKSSVELNPQVK